MKTMTITVSHKPNAKEEKKLRSLMRTEQLGELVVRIKQGDTVEDMVLELKKQDAEGRELLYG